MNIKQIAIGVCLAPLSLAEPVWAQNPQVPSLPTSAGNTECEVGETVVPVEPQENSLGREIMPTCVNLAQDLGQVEEASIILFQALEFAQAITNPAKKATVLSEIALRYVNLGEDFQANSILSQALEAVEAIEDDAEKASVLTAIALNTAEMGQTVRANDILSQALEIANTIEDGEVQGSLFTEIALAYADLGQPDISRELVSFLPGLTPVPLDTPLEPTPWQGGLFVSSQLFSGNKTINTLIVGSQLGRQWSRDELNFGLVFLNSFDNSRVAPEEENQIRGEFNSEYRYHPSDRQYYVISSGLLKDELSDINFRADTYLGSGINLWRGEEPNQALDMQLGLGVRYDDAVEQDSEVDFPVAEYKLSYKDIFFANLTFNQALSFQLSLDNTDDYIAEAATIISVPLSDRWSLNNGAYMIYESEPAGDTTNFRVNVDTGIQYNF